MDYLLFDAYATLAIDIFPVEDWSDETSGGGYPGGGDPDPDPEPDPNPIPEVKKELDEYPCASDVYDSFGSFDAEITNLLAKTFKYNHTFHVTFKGADLPPEDDGLFQGVDGTTRSDAKGVITEASFEILINDYVLKNSTKEYIAVTFAHETLHALIQYYEINDPQKLEELFPVFFNTMGLNDEEHVTMGKLYIDEMVDVIKQINPNMPTVEATCLAWGGLQGTTAYELKAFEFDQINGCEGAWDELMKTVNERERNGEESASGTKCKN
jgi:hypothetical protein